MKWCVVLQAEGDRVLTREEIVELADAVAGWNGVASGIGVPAYSARLVLEAGDREAAVVRATEDFALAAERAGLPAWPIALIDVVNEEEDDLREDFDYLVEPEPTPPA